MDVFMSQARIGAITFDWYPFDPLVRRMAEAAVDGGYSVDVICLRQQGEKRFEVYNEVNIYRLPMNRGFGRSLPITLLSWCWFTFLAGMLITRLHLKHRYAVIHVHNMPDFLVFSALFPRLFGAKIILHVQDVAPELMGVKAGARARKIVTRLASWQERISTAFAQHVITVGWPFERLLLQRGVSEKKLTIILNSADPRIFDPALRRPLRPGPYSAENPLILMYHGTLAERNGLDTALRALALALPDAPHVRFRIKGRGEHLPALIDLTHELGLDEVVEFSAPCPFEELVEFIVQGDVGVIPYRNDGFMELVLPTKSYEFAWMQRPMIVSDTPAVRSLFRPEAVAFCAASQPESFAHAIVDLYQHSEKLLVMVANAAEDYTPYQWEKMARRYQDLLGILSRGNQSEKTAEELRSNIASGV